MREALALRAQSGPYRFLVGRWTGISDMNLALRVLETEFFRDDVIPVPLPVDTLRSILVLAPHPDDEVIGAGGALQLAADSGAKIDILYVTDGAERNPPKGLSSVDLVAIREREAEQVCSMLGANMHRLGVSNPVPRPTLDNLTNLAGIIDAVRPQVVLAPWILDLPPKHRLVNHLLWLADRRSRLPDFEVWGYQVHNTLFPNGYVDITNVMEQKSTLLRCYRSQNERHMRYDHSAVGLAAWNSRLFPSTEPKFIELYFALPLREHLGLIERFYFADLLSTYRGHNDVLAGALRLHEEVVGRRRSHTAVTRKPRPNAAIALGDS